jgi:hypothetical protein
MTSPHPTRRIAETRAAYQSTTPGPIEVEGATVATPAVERERENFSLKILRHKKSVLTQKTRALAMKVPSRPLSTVSVLEPSFLRQTEAKTDLSLPLLQMRITPQSIGNWRIRTSSLASLTLFASFGFAGVQKSARPKMESTEYSWKRNLSEFSRDFSSFTGYEFSLFMFPLFMILDLN